MATKVYIAISSTSKTGDTVVGGDGATYSATFATFTLAFADATYGARDLVALDEQAIYQAFESLTDRITTSSALWVTNAASSIIIENQANVKHGGDYTAGVSVSGTASYNFAHKLSNDTLVRGLILINLSGTGASCVEASGLGVVIDSCILRLPSAAGNSYAIRMYSGATLKNSLVIARVYGIQANSGYSYNNVCVGASGWGYGGSGLRAVNSAGFGNGTDFLALNAESKNCASSDATAVMADSLINQVGTDCFEDYTGENYKLKAGSPLNGVGYDLSGINDTDIDGQPWEVPYSIGFDQPGDFLVPVHVTVLDKTTKLPIGLTARVFLRRVDNKVTVMAEATNVAGLASTDAVYVADTPVEGWVREWSLTGLDYNQEDIFGTIDNEGLSLAVRLTPKI